MIEPISWATLQVTPILTWFGCWRFEQLLERIQERLERNSVGTECAECLAGRPSIDVCWVNSQEQEEATASAEECRPRAGLQEDPAGGGWLECMFLALRMNLTMNI